MFDNLNWWEIGGLLILALLIFGDRLPQVINDGLKMLRNLRRMATSATTDLSRELGTDIQLTDLHPKTFLRKHILSEEDEAMLRRPLEGLHKDLQKDLGDVSRAADLSERGNGSGHAASAVPSQPGEPDPPVRRSYDLDAT